MASRQGRASGRLLVRQANWSAGTFHPKGRTNVSKIMKQPSSKRGNRQVPALHFGRKQQYCPAATRVFRNRVCDSVASLPVAPSRTVSTHPLGHPLGVCLFTFLVPYPAKLNSKFLFRTLQIPPGASKCGRSFSELAPTFVSFRQPPTSDSSSIPLTRLTKAATKRDSRIWSWQSFGARIRTACRCRLSKSPSRVLHRHSRSTIAGSHSRSRT